MKKKVTLLTCAIIILTSVTALCSETMIDNIATALEPMFEPETDIVQASEPEEGFFELEMNDSVEEIALFSVSAQTYVQALDDYITTNDFEEPDARRIKNRFISTLADFNMSTTEAGYVNSLIAEDYDIEKVLDIYTFIRWANADISMIEQIYLAGESNSDEEYWIYDTYDELLNRDDDILSVEDVAYYVASGISVDEIAGAYELSFSGVKTTKEMLAERLDGETWNSIAASVVSSNPSFMENAPEMSIGEILTYKNYAVRARADISDIIEINNDTITISDTVINGLNTLSQVKQRLIDLYDAEISVEEPEINLPYNYSDDAEAFIFDEDAYLTEDDLIPVEEPEVE